MVARYHSIPLIADKMQAQYKRKGMRLWIVIIETQLNIINPWYTVTETVQSIKLKSLRLGEFNSHTRDLPAGMHSGECGRL